MDPEPATPPKTGWKPLNLPQPGPFEAFNREARACFPSGELFDGAKLDYTKSLSPYFALTHSLSLGAARDPPSYNFTATHATNKLHLQGRVDPSSGHLSARIHRTLVPGRSVSATVQVGPEGTPTVAQAEYDHRGADFHLNVKAAPASGVYEASYMQSLAPRLAAGYDVFYHGQARMSGLMGVGRYRWGTGVLAIQASTFGQHALSYSHTVSEHVTLATKLDLVTARGDLQTKWSAGYRFALHSATVRGEVDSDGTVGSMLEQKLGPGITFLLSGELQHARKDYKIGVGLRMGE